MSAIFAPAANLASPGPIGGTTPAAGTFTTVNLTGNNRITIASDAEVFLSEGIRMGDYGSPFIEFGSTTQIRWSSGTVGVNGDDIILLREGPGILALRNGVDAQTLNVYNTWTDADNNERGVIEWDSNVLKIGAVAEGTGTLRALNLLGSAIQVNGAAGATAILTSITGITVTKGIVTSITGT